jgi:acyl carrier protein
MTADSPALVIDESALYADIVAVLSKITGLAPSAAPTGIRPTARLESDLRMDSIEVAALGRALAERFGDRVDLAQLLAGLDLDELIALTVADLTGFVASRLPEMPSR